MFAARNVVVVSDRRRKDEASHTTATHSSAGSFSTAGSVSTVQSLRRKRAARPTTKGSEPRVLLDSLPQQAVENANILPRKLPFPCDDVQFGDDGAVQIDSVPGAFYVPPPQAEVQDDDQSSRDEVVSVDAVPLPEDESAAIRSDFWLWSGVAVAICALSALLVVLLVLLIAEQGDGGDDDALSRIEGQGSTKPTPAPTTASNKPSPTLAAASTMAPVGVHDDDNNDLVINVNAFDSFSAHAALWGFWAEECQGFDSGFEPSITLTCGEVSDDGKYTIGIEHTDDPIRCSRDGTTNTFVCSLQTEPLPRMGNTIILVVCAAKGDAATTENVTISAEASAIQGSSCTEAASSGLTMAHLCSRSGAFSGGADSLIRLSQPTDCKEGQNIVVRPGVNACAAKSKACEEDVLNTGCVKVESIRTAPIVDEEQCFVKNNAANGEFTDSAITDLLNPIDNNDFAEHTHSLLLSN